MNFEQFEPMNTTAFVGQRLTEARELMGLQVSHLAHLLGVSRQRVYQLEANGGKPEEILLHKTCTVLNQPIEFFFNNNTVVDYGLNTVHFRGTKGAKDIKRLRAGTILKWGLEYYIWLERKLRLPAFSLPNLNPPRDPNEITQEFIEYAVSEVRTHWGLGDEPMPNLVALLERSGVVVLQSKLEIGDLDGASFWSAKQNRPIILLNSDKSSSVRSRFDAAHELGHMMLHRFIEPGYQKQPPLWNLIEHQAHAFAAALLLPAKAWWQDVRSSTLVGFKNLKPKWRTSIKAMIKRAYDLGHIDADRYKSLNKQYSYMVRSGGEPFDDRWELEKPQLLNEATRFLLGNGFTGEDIARGFSRRVEILAEMTDVPISELQGNAIVIKFA